MFFGAHVSSSGGIYRAVDRAVALGADGLQLFVQSPRTWRAPHHDDDAVRRFRERREEVGLQGAIAHAIYLINVASADEAVAERSVLALEQTMVTAERLGLDAVVFHPGSHKGHEDGLDGCIERIAAALATVLARSEHTWLLLENSAGQGGTIGRTIDELAAIVDACDRHPRLGICLDSCHWHASGVDVGDAASLDAQLDELDRVVGLDRLRALHLNDSMTPLGSNRDRHANIGAGEIGTGLATFLGHPRLRHLGAWLEVPGEGDGPTAAELAEARRLHALGADAWDQIQG